MSLLDPLVAYGSQGALAAINFSIERDDDLHEAMRGLAGKTIGFRLDIPGALDGLAFYGSFARDGLLEGVRAEPGPRLRPSSESESRSDDAADQSPKSPNIPTDVTLGLSPAFFSTIAGQATAGLWPRSTSSASDEGQTAPRSGGSTRPTGPAALQGVRIEGDAAIAQRFMPLLEVMRARLSPFQLALARFPLVGLAQRAAHYAVYDAGILVRRAVLLAHSQAVRALRERLDRLEKRAKLIH